MYNSWWFVAMLILFSLNLIVCTLDRLPNVWRMVVLDNLDTEIGRLEKMRDRAVFRSAETRESLASLTQVLLNGSGWKTKRADKDGGVLLFCQKGAWTRLGVYMVHTSILIIFVGAIIGAMFGYKASVMIPEGTSTDRVYLFDENHTEKPLGFSVRCDKFTMTYYDNGTPKEFRSELVVTDPNGDITTKSIIVNDPLDHHGITFYQSSYQAMENDFFVHIENLNSGKMQIFSIPPRKQATWSDENVTFGIVNITRSDRIGKLRYKIWFNDGKGEPSEFWADEETPVTIERADNIFTFNIKQRFATGLQVAMDPGVWTVYFGCILMLFGLYVAFFLSHRRLWVYIDEDDKGARVVLSGTSNKNKLGFEKTFAALADKFRNNDKLNDAGA
jgi:cytochrome c biogenesis protein